MGSSFDPPNKVLDAFLGDFTYSILGESYEFTPSKLIFLDFLNGAVITIFSARKKNRIAWQSKPNRIKKKR